VENLNIIVKEFLVMKSSRGEIKIFEILTEAGLDFQEEYSFKDLVSSSGRPLRFDFAVFDDNGDIDFLIEFQGIQHYEPKSKFGGAKGLYQQKYNDNQKKKYCLEHGYTLICIPYWEESFVDYDYIMKAAGY
jgi:hypothetical protein